MGRPRKEVHAVQAHEPAIDESVLGERHEVKLCPRCGDKSTGPYKDSHGNFRCNCSNPPCSFWDSQVSMTPADAVKSWNQAGGPSERAW